MFQKSFSIALIFFISIFLNLSSTCRAKAGLDSGEQLMLPEGSKAEAGFGSTRSDKPKLALTPPMGWNSWNCFKANISEQLIKEIADAMVSSGMRDAGYKYLVLDDGWMAPERDGEGRLMADPVKFPNGMKAVGDYIHSIGLKFGIYECRGYLTCQRLPGSFEHEDIDMASFASWGVDYIKLDACYAEKNGRLTTDDLQIYKDAIAKTGRPMILSISDFGNGAWAWGGKEYGQLWRTSYDIYPWIENVYHHAETSGGDLRIHPAFNGLWQFAGPGHWNDPDMLEIGNLKSEAEDKIHMSLWCMLASPLMAGNDLRKMSDTVTRVLIAPEVIAVNQDIRGHQGYKIFDNGKQQVYNKPLSDGTTAVLLFNKDSIPADISVTWDQIGLTGKQKVRDLWARKDLGKFENGFTAKQLPQHGQYLLKVGKPGSEPIPGPSPVPQEKYMCTNNGFSYLSDLYYIMKYGQAPLFDQGPEGLPLKLDGIVYEKGLSCQDGSILIYKTGGNATRFRAMVGLDDSYTGDKTGRFRVLNEDAFGAKVLFDSGLMSKDSLAKQIDIDIRGMDCIFLKFDGKEATGNWAHARMVATWDEHLVTYDDQFVDSLISRMELIPIRINGDKDNRINIVIINRWEERDQKPYNRPEMRQEFIDDVNRSLLAAFTPDDPAAQTAYANYQQFFNLYALWWPDTPMWRNGVETDLIDAIRDRLFLPWKNEHTGWVTFLIMPNRDGGGGGAARNLEARTGNAVIAGNAIGKMLHEISHTCTSIGDEYTAAATGTDASPAYTVSKEYLRNEIKWKAWIDPETPLPTPYTREYIDKIGAFEGGQYHLTNYFRSSAQGCIMGAGVFDNTEEMCAICEQRLAMRMYDLVYPIEEAFPADQELTFSTPGSQHFSVQRVHPVPDTQETHWILNGKIIASGVDEIDLSFNTNEAYELVFTVRDITEFIREDPPYGEFPYREKRWLINSSRKDAPKYTFVWTDADPLYLSGHRYEAEKTGLQSSDSEVIPYYGASEQAFLKFGENAAMLEWNIRASRSGWYDLLFVYASAQKGTQNFELLVNGKVVQAEFDFPESRPLYTGWWDRKVTVQLKAGDNKIRLSPDKACVIHFDYLWVPDSPGSEPAKRVGPATFVMEKVNLKRMPNGMVKVLKPDPQLQYLWYEDDIPVYQEEILQDPLTRGASFHPAKEGNYYLAARKADGSQSSNRMGFYYTEHPVKKRQRSILPNQVKSSKLLLWLDASDLNADGLTDDPAPPRDPYNKWIDKASGMKGPFILYKPNQQNGKGVAGFEMVWVTDLEKAVTDFQTVIMVYRESSMSFPGTTPFRALDGKLDLKFDKDSDQYKILIAEFESQDHAELKRTQGNWEGSLAELIIYDGVLSDQEKHKIEVGLLKKWFGN